MQRAPASCIPKMGSWLGQGTGGEGSGREPGLRVRCVPSEERYFHRNLMQSVTLGRLLAVDANCSYASFREAWTCRGQSPKDGWVTLTARRQWVSGLTRQIFVYPRDSLATYLMVSATSQWSVLFNQIVKENLKNVYKKTLNQNLLQHNLNSYINMY